MRRTLTARFHTATAAAALLLATGIVVTACQKVETSTLPEPRPVRSVTVTLVAERDVIRYPAVIKPRIEADLGFRLAGKVVARLVEVGARVEEGTPLARLDPADVDLQVRAARAQLAAVKADADNARADFERYAKLKQGEWTTSQEYDRRKTLLEKAEARVREVDASLNVLANSLQYTTLKADGSGIVTAVLVEPGQVVAAGQPAIRVAREGELEAVAHIPEHKLKGLSGHDLAVELWSLPGVTIAGTLREVSPSADPGTRTFQARIALKDAPKSVQLGMTATLVASEQEGAPVARLPLAALTQQGNLASVWVVDPRDNRLSLRKVEVAAYSGDEVTISDGLKNGETVVTAGVHKLGSGEKVRLWTAAGP